MRLTNLAMNVSSIKLTGLCQSQAAFHYAMTGLILALTLKNKWRF